MKEGWAHRGRAVQIQIMFLGNDPERERAFIPLMSNEVDLPEPSKIKRIIFKTTKWGWFCFIWMAPQHAESCKELMQTYLRCGGEGTENNEAKREENPPPSHPFLFTFHWWIWAHDLKYATPPTHLPICAHTHTHTDVRAHKSTVGCILGLPSHPYSSTLPSPTFI